MDRSQIRRQTYEAVQRRAGPQGDSEQAWSSRAAARFESRFDSSELSWPVRARAQRTHFEGCEPMVAHEVQGAVAAQNGRGDLTISAQVELPYRFAAPGKCLDAIFARHPDVAARIDDRCFCAVSERAAPKLTAARKG